MTREFQTRLKRRLLRAGIRMPPDVCERLEAYYRLLTRWNQKINLTSMALEAFPDVTLDRLLVEPLVAASHVAETAFIIDVGSGGGSPAIPMKLALPEATLTMVESKARKAAFLRESIRQLDLHRTAVETARLEELLPRADLHEAADILSMRAVRVEPKLLTTLQAFVKPAGALLLFRGPTGLDLPTTLTPPLAWEATFPLVESLRSRLVIIRKSGVGPSSVPLANRRAHFPASS